SQGLRIAQDLPRFSTGYVDLQNRPAVLLEMHMLKDYRTRVSGSYEFLRALLEIVNREASRIVEMNRVADAATVAAGPRREAGVTIPLRLEADGTTEPFTLRGFKSIVSQSEVSGGRRIEYTREPIETVVPRQIGLKVTLGVTPPAAYLIPAQ